MNTWDETKHKRDTGGRFTSTGGHVKPTTQKLMSRVSDTRPGFYQIFNAMSPQAQKRFAAKHPELIASLEKDAKNRWVRFKGTRTANMLKGAAAGALWDVSTGWGKIPIGTLFGATAGLSTKTKGMSRRTKQLIKKSMDELANSKDPRIRQAVEDYRHQRNVNRALNVGVTGALIASPVLGRAGVIKNIIKSSKGKGAKEVAGKVWRRAIRYPLSEKQAIRSSKKAVSQLPEELKKKMLGKNKTGVLTKRQLRKIEKLREKLKSPKYFRKKRLRHSLAAKERMIARMPLKDWVKYRFSGPSQIAATGLGTGFIVPSTVSGVRGGYRDIKKNWRDRDEKW